MSDRTGGTAAGRPPGFPAAAAPAAPTPPRTPSRIAPDAPPAEPADAPPGGVRDAARAMAAWALARHALRLALADPDGLGGVVLHGRHGPSRDALLGALTRRGPVRRVPADVDDEALVGGLDVGATLAAGRPVQRAGLLDLPPGETLLLVGAERLTGRAAARLRAWLDGECGGTAARAPLVALDEGLDGPSSLDSALG